MEWTFASEEIWVEVVATTMLEGTSYFLFVKQGGFTVISYEQVMLPLTVYAGWPYSENNLLFEDMLKYKTF